MDNVKSQDFDLKLLQVLKVRFIKISAAALLDSARTEAGFAKMSKLKRTLEGNGIGFIAEKIETEETVKNLLDYDIRYGQGHLFGKPGPQASYKQKKVA